MHSSQAGELGAIFGVEVEQIGQVLEKIGVKFLAVEGQVGLDIVGVLNDFQVDVLL